MAVHPPSQTRTRWGERGPSRVERSERRFEASRSRQGAAKNLGLVEEASQGVLDGSPRREVGVGQDLEPGRGLGQLPFRARGRDPAKLHLGQAQALREAVEDEAGHRGFAYKRSAAAQRPRPGSRKRPRRR